MFTCEQCIALNFVFLEKKKKEDIEKIYWKVVCDSLLLLILYLFKAKEERHLV